MPRFNKEKCEEYSRIKKCKKDQLLGLIIVYIETNKYKKASLAKRQGNVLFIVWQKKTVLTFRLE